MIKGILKKSEVHSLLAHAEHGSCGSSSIISWSIFSCVFLIFQTSAGPGATTTGQEVRVKEKQETSRNASNALQVHLCAYDDPEATSIVRFRFSWGMFIALRSVPTRKKRSCQTMNSNILQSCSLSRLMCKIQVLALVF